MPSVALRTWDGARSAALDEMGKAHRAVGGEGAGRRQARQQINQAYAMLLSSQFQGFCRDLHTECATHLALPATSPALRAVHRENLLHGRRLDVGNPNPGNLGNDFNRLGLDFWAVVVADDVRNAQRRDLLERLNRWRNAIAHDSFEPDMLRAGRPALRLAEVEEWRKACSGLGRSFDKVLYRHLLTLTGHAPW
jgi:hypothetical protein